MKHLKKLLVADIILFVLAVIFFKVFILGGILTAFAFGLGVYIFLNCRTIRKEVKHQESIPKEELRRMAIDEKLRKAKQTVENTEAFRNSYVEAANKQIAVFRRKEAALNTIIGLNEDGCSTTLTNNSLDVYDTIVENYRRMSKRMLAYETTHNEEIQEEVAKILATNEELLELYNRLIEEVSRMGDDFNEQDEELQSLITNLQTLRKNNEAEADGNDDPFSVEIPSTETLQI